MELRKKVLLIVCVLVSLSGITIIYLSVLRALPSETKISEIDSRLIGKLVSIRGKISYVKFHPEGHIFLTVVEGNSRVEVPIFSSLANKLKSNGIDQYDLRRGRSVRITGIVGEYKGQLQIVPRKPSDVQILGSE